MARIAAICRVYPTQRPGGMPFVCQTRAEALAALGHEVHVLTTGHAASPAALTRMTVGGVDVRHLPCPYGVYSDAFAHALVEACDDLSPDIVHLDGHDPDRPWWRTMRARGRLGISLHGFEMGTFLTAVNLWRAGRREAPAFPAERIGRQVECLSRDFDAVMAPSRHEYLMLVDHYGLDTRRVRLVYNPIPSYFFADVRPWSAPPSDGEWLCAAVSGHAERGFDLAREAVARVGARLRVVHDRAREEMPAVIDECRGLVLPTFYAQGYDLTVAEALARGRPVIASATGSYLREGERSADTGITPFPTGDVGRLAESLAGPLPTITPAMSERFRPARHVDSWLHALGV